MRTIKAKPITAEDFAAYGSFANILDLAGSSIGNFYNDKVLLPVSEAMPVAFSALIVEKPEKMIVTEAEYHNTTGKL